MEDLAHVAAQIPGVAHYWWQVLRSAGRGTLHLIAAGLTGPAILDAIIGLLVFVRARMQKRTEEAKSQVRWGLIWLTVNAAALCLVFFWNVLTQPVHLYADWQTCRADLDCKTKDAFFFQERTVGLVAKMGAPTPLVPLDKIPVLRDSIEKLGKNEVVIVSLATRYSRAGYYESQLAPLFESWDVEYVSIQDMGGTDVLSMPWKLPWSTGETFELSRSEEGVSILFRGSPSELQQKVLDAFKAAQVQVGSSTAGRVHIPRDKVVFVVGNI